MTPLQASFDTLIDNWIDNNTSYIDEYGIDAAVEAFWEQLGRQFNRLLLSKIKEYLDEAKDVDESLTKTKTARSVFESLSVEDKHKVVNYMRKLSK